MVILVWQSRRLLAGSTLFTVVLSWILLFHLSYQVSSCSLSTLALLECSRTTGDYFLRFSTLTKVNNKVYFLQSLILTEESLWVRLLLIFFFLAFYTTKQRKKTINVYLQFAYKLQLSTLEHLEHRVFSNKKNSLLNVDGDTRRR